MTVKSLVPIGQANTEVKPFVRVDNPWIWAIVAAIVLLILKRGKV